MSTISKICLISGSVLLLAIIVEGMVISYYSNKVDAINEEIDSLHQELKEAEQEILKYKASFEAAKQVQEITNQVVDGIIDAHSSSDYAIKDVEAAKQDPETKEWCEQEIPEDICNVLNGI